MQTYTQKCHPDKYKEGHFNRLDANLALAGDIKFYHETFGQDLSEMLETVRIVLTGQLFK